MSSAEVFNINKVVWQEFGPGNPRTAIYQGSEHLTIQYFELPSKSQGPPEHHPEEQIACVLKGMCRFWVEGKTYEAGPGCLIRIPANAEHYGMNPGNQTAVTLEIFIPKRAGREQSQPE